MKNIQTIIYIFLVLTIIACTPTKALLETEKQNEIEKKEAYEVIFPDDWMGYWKGDLEIFKENKLVQTIPMALDHAFTDTLGYYRWAIIYGPDSISGRRDYYLNTIDSSIGHYQTDERNSIFLDSYLFENRLIAFFEVGSTKIQSTYTRSGEEMHFEIIAIGSDPVAITGNEIVKGDTIPEVKSFPIKAVQKAILRKVR